MIKLLHPKVHNWRLQLFCNRGRLVLEIVNGKLELLRELLVQGSPDTIRHTLVYAADKNPEQLDALESFIDLPVTLRENLIESYDTIQPQPKQSTTKPLSSKADCTETNWTSRLEPTPTESIPHHPRFRISHAA